MKPEQPDRMFQVIAVWQVLARDATEAIDVIQHSYAVKDAPAPDRWDVIDGEWGEANDDEAESGV